ncbi:MAG: CaiB/BaiF CoA transferase family protein [Polymorphobacter sp.]
MTVVPQRRPSLDGIRVLDLSRVLAGPWCTMILADLGAEVIKIENPRGGDDTRKWGPPYAAGEAAYYLAANRNKQSVSVNIATQEGQAIIRGLALQCDVLVENYKLGGLDKYGLDYASLAALNPRLIYCSISGYGRTGPRAAEPGYDYVIQAEGGLMSFTGEIDGEPMKAGVAVADLFTGMAAAQAILAAIIAQQRDGLGQHIDMALFDCQLAMLANIGSSVLVSGDEPQRYGNGHPTVVPYQLFKTSDGEVVIAVGNDGQFAHLCTNLLHRPDLSDDPRFATNSARVIHRVALGDELVPLIAAKPTQYWLDGLRAAGVPAGAVRSVGTALASPETAARGMVGKVTHPTAGEVALIASPLKLSGTPPVTMVAPPLLGEHTQAVLRRFGLADLALGENNGSAT